MLIKLNNVTVKYGKSSAQVMALDDFSLEVEQGAFLSIIGKSGSGKSTLLNVLGGIRKPDYGEYFYQDQLVNKMNDGEAAKFRNKNIGFVVQHFALIQEKTVYDNIALPLIYQKVKKIEINKRINDVLEKLSISEKKYAYPSELSGGQCQRVAIARALVTEPTLILADEPTGNLDSNNAWEIMKLLEEINERGTTVIVVTHNMEIVKTMKKRVITIQKGVIVNDSCEDEQDEN